MFYINIFCINNFFGVWQKDRDLILICITETFIVIAEKHKEYITKKLDNITAAEVHIFT